MKGIKNVILDNQNKGDFSFIDDPRLFNEEKGLLFMLHKASENDFNLSNYKKDGYFGSDAQEMNTDIIPRLEWLGYLLFEETENTIKYTLCKNYHLPSELIIPNVVYKNSHLSVGAKLAFGIAYQQKYMHLTDDELIERFSGAFNVDKVIAKGWLDELILHEFLQSNKG